MAKMSAGFEPQKDEGLDPLPDGTEIHLPVCERCGHAGKQPMNPDTKFFCDGGTKKPHKKTRMVAYVFRSAGPVPKG